MTVALASGQNTNVFSVANEYYGNNGQIHYNVRLGLPVYDTNPLPANGCTVASADTSEIYADGSGYNACLDDNQLQAEVNSVTAARGLPHNLSHIYVLYLPKARRVLLQPRFDRPATAGGQACTINHQPTAAYCAYHSEDPANAVYANMPYPIYQSPVGFTCGSDARFPVIESPNGNQTRTPRSAPPAMRSMRRLPTRTPRPATTTPAASRTANRKSVLIFGATTASPGGCTTRRSSACTS